ncbi:hypothetical protein A357_0123 [Candidatus Carsonella ruddii PC isolate NHV]|uniref:4Fe-4S ferredoxin-type domain-containing protein n=1 Tax=Candidatus Carsonella ruddii PC isolate NHV TaxID=1202540 RepID=J3VQV2_CARRU|nr:hypothetical protein A357_0123 [Candidatus Carsonella ruddii PC isolate NHV]
MKIKNFLLYTLKKKKIKKNCTKCNFCIKICPLNLFLIKKKNLIKSCKICNLCVLNCFYKCIK